MKIKKILLLSIIFIIFLFSSLFALRKIIIGDTPGSLVNRRFFDYVAIDRPAAEWLMYHIFEGKNYLRELIVTTIVEGKVVDVDLTGGEISGLRYYQVGELEGTYEYLIKIRLASKEYPEQETNYFFSPRRVELAKLYNEQGEEINFEQIEPGSSIRIEETVDLMSTNRDDANVKSLLIRVQ
jgi:hypothetical protein